MSEEIVKENVGDERDEIEGLQQEHWRKWYLLMQGIFYFGEGAMVALIALIPIFMQDYMGVDETTSIELLALINIPWYIKIVWGFLSDNVTFKSLGRRKPYIIISGILAILGSVWMPTFTEVNLLFVLVGIMMSTGIALSDAVIDSLSVDITPTEYRFMMEGVAWGGRGLGAALSAVGLSRIASTLGWLPAFLFPSLIVLFGCFLALFVKEPPITDTDKVLVFNGKVYRKEFLNPDLWLVSFFLIITGSGIAVLTVFSTFLKNTVGLSIEDIGVGVSILAIGQFAGAVVTGVFGESLSVKKMLLVTTLGYVAVISSVPFIPLTDTTVLYIMIIILGAVNGAYEVVQMRIAMEFSVGPIAGSLYNWYMSMTNIGQISLGAIVIANAAKVMGYPAGIQFASIFLLAGLVIGKFTVDRMDILKAKYAEKNKEEDKTAE